MASPERTSGPNSGLARSSSSPSQTLAKATTVAALTLLFVSPLPAQTFDELLTYHQNRTLVTTSLPAGPVASSLAFPVRLDDLAVLPSGRVLSMDGDLLIELKPGGVVLPIGTIEELPPGGGTEFNGFLTATSDGRLFLLRYVYGLFENYLTELDPATGASLRTVLVSELVDMLAPAPNGLWTRHYLDRTLHRLDPESGDLGPPLANLNGLLGILDADTDSSGRIYFVDTCPVCSPPNYSILSLDPTLGGALRSESTLESLVPFATFGLAIRRRCHETATSRCLQGGRFRAEITYRDFLGESGDAKVAAAQGQDTGIFYFFSKANWELMVKVLDGCALNGHYWVFTSASTDVEFRLEVTDTQTLSTRSYQNPLGQAARAIADINAFPCTATLGEQP